MMLRWASLGFVAVWWAGVQGLGGFRTDHLLVGLLILGLSLGGPHTRPAFRLLLPLIIVGVVYDSQRFFQYHLRDSVYVVEPYALEKRLFGVTTADGIVTLNEWLQVHSHPALDLLSGACYLSFIPGFVAFAAFFLFRLSRTGSAKRSAAYVSERAPRVMWSLLWLNLMAFVTTSLYPVAPPWYVALHGFGPVDVLARPSPAGCIRFDELLGIHVFASFYGRSCHVFGAIPSLHVAYPMLATYYAFQFGAARALSLGLFLAMCFSAVYLNHHYVVDVVAGAAYALVVARVLDALYAWQPDRSMPHGAAVLVEFRRDRPGLTGA